ncbi:MAG: AtpZ/AtpI family protein [Acidimicrobiales bacterium]
MDLRERRDLNNGLDTGMSRAMELVLTPLLFAGAGIMLDRWLDTSPVFAVVLGVLALIGVSYMTWFRYEMEMREHDRSGPWATRAARTSPGSDVSRGVVSPDEVAQVEVAPDEVARAEVARDEVARAEVARAEVAPGALVDTSRGVA